MEIALGQGWEIYSARAKCQLHRKKPRTVAVRPRDEGLIKFVTVKPDIAASNAAITGMGVRSGRSLQSCTAPR